MKKIFFVMFMMLFVISCGNSQEKMDAAKQELLNPQEQTADSQTGESDTASGSEITDEAEQVSSGIEIIEYGQNPVLQFDELHIDDFLDGEAEITGETLTQVDSIEVHFSNRDSQFPEDTYMLKTFTSGDARFTYRAASGFKVLDFGENIYTFRAKSGNTTVETQVIVRLPKEQTSQIADENSQPLLSDDTHAIVLSNLPTASKYGEPIRLGESSFTYSGIKGLEIEKKSLPEVTCETLGQYLSESQTSYYFWNTCRDIVKEKGITFNIIRLQGDAYIYERHYIDRVNGFYGRVELETGTGVDKDTIAAKNSQLKDQDFPLIEVVDDLIKDIVNL